MRRHSQTHTWTCSLTNGHSSDMHTLSPISRSFCFLCVWPSHCFIKNYSSYCKVCWFSDRLCWGECIFEVKGDYANSLQIWFENVIEISVFTMTVFDINVAWLYTKFVTSLCWWKTNVGLKHAILAECQVISLETLTRICSYLTWIFPHNIYGRRNECREIKCI